MESAMREALSAYQPVEKLTDKRRAQGTPSSLALILTCVLLANMAGKTTRQAITEWGRRAGAGCSTSGPKHERSFPARPLLAQCCGAWSVPRGNGSKLHRFANHERFKRLSSDEVLVQERCPDVSRFLVALTHVPCSPRVGCFLARHQPVQVLNAASPPGAHGYADCS